MTDLSRRYKISREDAGLRQIDVAKKIGVSVNMISRIELDTITPPVKILAASAKIFGVTSDYLLGLSDNPN